MKLHKYLKYIILAESHKYNVKSISRLIISILILLMFEFYLIMNSGIEITIIKHTHFKLIISLTSFVLALSFWSSFRNSYVHTMFKPLPVNTKKLYLSMVVYIFLEVGLKRMIYLLILPIFLYIQSGISLTNTIIMMISYVLMIFLTFSCVIIFFETTDLLKKIILTILLLLVSLSPLLLSSLLIIIMISLIYVYFDGIKLLENKKVNKSVEKKEKVSLLKIEIKKWVSDKSNWINSVIAVIFTAILTFNLNSIKNIDPNINYFLIMIIILAMSPVYLLFSTDKNYQRVYVYLPINKHKVFLIKFFICLILMLTMLTLSIVIFSLIRHNVDLKIINIYITMLFCAYFRLKFDQKFPILNWSSKQDIWKNPKKYISLIILIPYIYMALTYSIWITLPLILVIFVLNKVKSNRSDYFVFLH
ncbi:antilisterial bacteriocin subtilosin biosynthesis protein AlbD [Staphylococcus caprae]|nr:antilisterial bacteriocin subtilosin biosynthesis protein AlbD [Staphylococcus caprae]